MLEKGVCAKIVNEKNTVFLTRSGVTLPPQGRRKLSLIPLTESVSNLTLKGLKYPVSGFTLKMGDSRGISNEFTESDAEITFDKGLLLIITSED